MKYQEDGVPEIRLKEIFMKIDEYGRVNSNAQDIRSMNYKELANLLDDIKSNPDNYPDSKVAWISWLSDDSK